MKESDIVETDLRAADLSEPEFYSLGEDSRPEENLTPGESGYALFEAESFVDRTAFDGEAAVEWLDCPAGEPYPSAWNYRVHAMGQLAVRVRRRTWQVLKWWVNLPVTLANGVSQMPWGRMLTVRKGFALGAVGGFLVASSSIWAISSLPYLPGHPLEPALTAPIELPNARLEVPSELAWFFIQFPYISESAKIRIKNHHTFVVIDNNRKKEYVVSLGQKFRRVEVYSQDTKNNDQVQIYTPGSKRTVWFQGTRIVGQTSVSDGNLWMWRTPLWNAVHLKIYGLADLWLDSPYKRYSCAGFVHKFLGDAGVTMPILDAWDIAKQPWKQVSYEEMEPGDIITIKAISASHRRFWHHRITHVGVYIGHGKFIHAATSSRHSSRSWVRIADVDDFRFRIDKILRPPELL